MKWLYRPLLMWDILGHPGKGHCHNITLIGWLILLPPSVGWDIMGYESEPLPYYLGLSNCFYSIMLNYTESPTTPQVHSPRPGPTISPSGLSPETDPLNTEFIDEVVGHLFRYCCLPPPDILSNGMNSCGFHCHQHLGVFKLPARPM